jgi:hypothetical protein
MRELHLPLHISVDMEWPHYVMKQVRKYTNISSGNLIILKETKLKFNLVMEQQGVQLCVN